MALLDKYYRISEVAGVAVTQLSGGEVQIHLCSVKANGNQLTIDKKITDLNSIHQLKQHLPEKCAVALNLSGKSVLHKQIKKTEKITQANFGQVATNAKIDDFYVQYFESGDQSFVSIIRRTEADRFLEQLKNSGFNIHQLSLGPFAVSTVQSQLNVYEGDLVLDGNVIQRNEKADWMGYSYEKSRISPFAVKLADEKIDERLVLPYAAAFQLVMDGQIDAVHAEVDELNSARQRKLSTIKFKVQGGIILGAFFLILLINLVLLSWLNSANNGLNEQALLNSKNISSLQDLDQQIKSKEALVAALGWDGGIKKSGLVDQVASLMPPDITLLKIAVDPTDQVGSRTKRSLSFFNRKIQISGNSGQIIPVNEWIARIKTKKWVKDVQMDSYAYDNEANTGRFLITINF